MTTNQPLSLFISSKMQELADARRAIQMALKAYHMSGWLWEDNAGARPEPIRSTYLSEVEACDIYIGLFWQGYGPYTIEEYQHARIHHKPCLIYEKHVVTEQRSPELTAFLQDLGGVDNPAGLTIRLFQTAEELARYVQEDVMRLLTTVFRNSRQQPPTRWVWNVPYTHSEFFLGRDALLSSLYNRLHQNKAAALPQAISGLGGIGKTQLAVEYAYRYRDEYDAILWTTASTYDTLFADVIALAEVLDLPEKDAQDQSITVNAVMRWLETSTRWLLIFDNADVLDLIKDFLPTSGTGHILLTTRSQATGAIAQPLEVTWLAQDDGALFLLRRARMLPPAASLADASNENQADARSIANFLDGLPLAIDQAGAYLEETGRSLSEYRDRYQRERTSVLKERGHLFSLHPESVVTTFSLSFQRVQKADQAAADLLRFFAFLSPEAIPLALLLEGAPNLGKPLKRIARNPQRVDRMLSVLFGYSLIRRDTATNTFYIHRLVQAVIKDEMSARIQHQWAERTVRAVNRTFPDVEVETWQRCWPLIPQAIVCMHLIDQWHMSFPEATRLLNDAALYLYEHAQYTEAEPLYQRALAIREKILGPDHPNTALSLNNLAGHYKRQGEYEQAEPLYQRALAIFEQRLGPDHPDTMTIRENYSNLLQETKEKQK